jgi:hypothetical protein
MGSKDSVLRQQMVVLQQKLLIHHPGHIRYRRTTCVILMETPVGSRTGAALP